MLSKISAPVRPRSRAAPLAITLAIVLAAAWAVPPQLDWGRFRTRIAAIAAARLGRPVTIGGDITLRLLPQAVLTANDVTLPDQGDGISVQVSALRLQVATLPLLAGHLRLRDLTLSAPTLNLPLTLPETIGHPTRPQIPHAFAARIEAGTLRIGQTQITGISAAIHGGPAIASTATSMPETIAPGGIPVAAFGAEGFATAAGRTWRFTSALGAPDADGVSAIDISIRGQGPAANTGATLQATLADGLMQGRLRASGTDLSQLMPASALAWQADTQFIASPDRIEANAIRLSLGGSPAEGSLTLELNAPARLEGQLHAASIDLDGWAGLLGHTFAPSPQTATLLPHLHVLLAAEHARLLGGTLQEVRAGLVSDGTSLGFDQAHAILPGRAMLEATEVRLAAADAKGAPAPLELKAHATLAAPNLPETLAWLAPLAPAQIGALPPGAMPTANLAGEIALSRTGLAATHVEGQLGATSLSGHFALRPSQRPALEADLDVDRLDLDPWLATLAAARSLPQFAHAVASPETALKLRATHANWQRFALENLSLEARTGAAGLHLAHADADLEGAHLSATGTAGPDGRLLGAQASLASPDLARLKKYLPASLAAPSLWQGAGRFSLAADGPPETLALQLRADLNDLVLEAEATRDTNAGTSAATITLRHPGAPRLLAALGLPGTAAWLDHGSLALRAHLQTTPTRLTAQDFDLNAASLRVSGHLQADWSAAPTLTGTLHADQLALPAKLPPPPAPATWASQLHLTADNVTIGLRPALQNVAADLASAGPDWLATNLQATLAGGTLTGQIAADLAVRTASAQLDLASATLPGPLTGGPIDLNAGSLTLHVDGWAPGLAINQLQGEARATLTAATLTGVNLAQLPKTAPRTRAARAQLQQALTQGTTQKLSAELEATIAHGQLTLDPAHLTYPSGAVTLTGHADLAANTADLRAAPTPTFSFRIAGPWQNLKADRPPNR